MSIDTRLGSQLSATLSARSVRRPKPGEKPRHFWCWMCGERLRLPHFRVLRGYDGHEHPVHAICALEASVGMETT